ncbi:NAD(P)/FAD-dependent oxidoreductase [Bacillus thermotolerans]|uniref:Sarcosine oxidase beta subunit n=1 Tax=Bacillus thermotolerans TaxID=1221996 RepID=A0A0F5HYX5_BACTR|nr:FAD-binding oxidoreductase [Bacillus thermotolerans]KKB38240.1 Sarcosine oxidase beta subunit [Bacillus thermotolerans]KKB39787.1 Sarcosine oxidase beta subunit [Bacillus thermotolerans]
MTKADIIIVGGGVMGSSTAYFLRKSGYTGRIIVFEKDPIYEFSSTPRSAGGIRQLFTTAINIQLSRFSLKQYEAFPEAMALDGEPAKIDFRQRGYLFLATQEMVSSIHEQKKLQNELNVPSQFLLPDELRSIIPELEVSDLAGGLYCSEDGYLDAYSVMKTYKKHAQRLGVEYILKEVDTFLTENGQMKGVRLLDGEEYHSPIVINCAGAWGALLSERIGLPLPIVPLKRQVFQFDPSVPLQKPLPLTIDPTGVYFRHEGDRIISGFSENIKPGIDFSWKRSHFEELWPVLAHRVPNFESVKLETGWAGLYDFNTEDQNAIIGEHPQMNGYYMALGFSGHGMQQAPGVGLGLAELIYKGKYETLDLTPLRVSRFAENDLVLEQAVV